MQFKASGKIIFLRFEHGEDLFLELERVLNSERVSSAVVLSGIGMLSNFEIGYMNMEKGEYEKTFYEEPHELLSLCGNVSLKDGKPFAHLHATVAGKDHIGKGGHLFRATVCNTLEMVIERLEGMKLIRNKYLNVD